MNTHSFQDNRNGRGTLFLVVLASLLTHCGDLTTGASISNDPAPVGQQIVAQGTFTPLNQKSVSGNAVLYMSSSGNYTLRLESLIAPSESGLEVSITGNGQKVFNTGLRTSTGSQNYTFSANAIATWEQVTLHSAPNNLNYAQALLKMTYSD